MKAFDKINAFSSARQIMVQHQLRRRGICDDKVLEAMSELPRHDFVPVAFQGRAYQDQPTAIGCGQTISQPYIVAYMTQELRLQAHHEVLEIGTGCGYQTAVLARLVCKVYTVEVIGPLAEQGRENLAQTGITNVEFHLGDGKLGWPVPRRFDRIIVTAAAEALPSAIPEQLAEDGRLIAPVGKDPHHRLLLFEKSHDEIKETFLCHSSFVKLV